jgi:hypothetical protein
MLGPLQDPPQQSVLFLGTTASPHYDHDHTAFASGKWTTCGAGALVCSVLYTTHDGGGSWHRLPAMGFAGGPVLLTPSYPADPIIFAASPAGLQRSDDGGLTFVTVVPGIAYSASVAPDSPPGDARVLISSYPQQWIYHARSGKLRTAGPQIQQADPIDVAFADDSEHVIVVTEHGALGDVAAPPATSGADRELHVLRCTVSGSCTDVMDGVDDGGGAVVVTRPWKATDTSDLVLSTPRHVYLSTDAGQHWRMIRALNAGTVVDVAVMRTNTMAPTVVIGWHDGVPDKLFIATSLDGGATFSEDPPTLSDAGSILFDGTHLLFTLSLAEQGVGYGIRCRPTEDAAWRTAC